MSFGNVPTEYENLSSGSRSGIEGGTGTVTRSLHGSRRPRDLERFPSRDGLYRKRREKGTPEGEESRVDLVTKSPLQRGLGEFKRKSS